MATPHYLSKKRCSLKSTPKGTQNSFLRDTFFRGLSQRRLHWGCRGLSFILDLSDQIFTFIFMVLHDIVVVCLFMFDGILYEILVYGICCLYSLLKIFPNYHYVCHPNNNVCTPFHNLVVVVTMDHRSSSDLGIQW